jgi:hypothetical protein
MAAKTQIHEHFDLAKGIYWMLLVVFTAWYAGDVVFSVQPSSWIWLVMMIGNGVGILAVVLMGKRLFFSQRMSIVAILSLLRSAVRMSLLMAEQAVVMPEVYMEIILAVGTLGILGVIAGIVYSLVVTGVYTSFLTVLILSTGYTYLIAQVYLPIFSVLSLVLGALVYRSHLMKITLEFQQAQQTAREKRDRTLALRAQVLKAKREEVSHA